MPALNNFFVSVVLAVVYSSNVMAVPSPATEPRFASAKLSTARTHMLPSGLTIESYNPPSILETFGAGIDHPLHKRAGASLQESSVAFIQDKLNLTYTGAADRYSYAAQTHKGISYANAVANVAFNKDDKVVVFGSSFVTPNTGGLQADECAGRHLRERRAWGFRGVRLGAHSGWEGECIPLVADGDNLSDRKVLALLDGGRGQLTVRQLANPARS
ncbi:hypothetical protein C8J57DRAFT_1248358 [Mycena rebaudengoi]|nr:hypothetical protein C8J57DRAFT_1248358 [Mycena rebaudengoi]